MPRGTFLGTSLVRQFGPTRAANNRAHNSSFSPAGCAPSSAPGPSPSRAGGSHFVPAVSTNAHNPFLLPTGPAARPNGGEATPLRPNPSNTPSAPRHSSRRAGVGSAVFVRAAQANAHNPFLHDPNAHNPIIVTSDLSLGESIAGPPSVSPDAR